jgi:hypothetical protein
MDPIFCVKLSSGGKPDSHFDLLAKVRPVQPCYLTTHLTLAPLEEGAAIVGTGFRAAAP